MRQGTRELLFFKSLEMTHFDWNLHTRIHSDSKMDKSPPLLLFILGKVFTPLESILLWFFKCLSADANNCDDLLRWLGWSRESFAKRIRRKRTRALEYQYGGKYYSSSFNEILKIIIYNQYGRIEGGITSLAIRIIQTHFLELLDQEQRSLDILQFHRLLSSDWWER